MRNKCLTLLVCSALHCIALHMHRSLSKITFGCERAAPTMRTATMESSMTEADLSRKNFGVSGAIIVAAFLSKW